MKEGGGLVKNIESEESWEERKLIGKIKKMRLEEGKSSRMMEEIDVKEEEIEESLKIVEKGRKGGEELRKLLKCNVEKIGNGIEIEKKIKCLEVIKIEVEEIEGKIKVWKEVNIDIDEEVEMKWIEEKEIEVEGKEERMIEERIGLRKERKKVEDWCERKGIGGRVGERGEKDRWMVNVNKIVEKLKKIYKVVLRRMIKRKNDEERRRIEKSIDKEGGIE